MYPFFRNLHGMGMPSQPWTFRCYSVSMMPGETTRDNVNRGGKIIMPPSALEQLTSQHLETPWKFKLTNKMKKRTTHCGVLEFIADEGQIFIPAWMMRNLLLTEGDLVLCEYTPLPVATYAKFQPQCQEFLEIHNPKAVLENALRSFACLTQGDIFAIEYLDKVFELEVKETKPGPAVCCIECDMNVEFDAPPGYVEPEKSVSESQDNKQAVTSQQTSYSGPRGMPDYDYKVGSITFLRKVPAESVVNGTEPVNIIRFDLRRQRPGLPS